MRWTALTVLLLGGCIGREVVDFQPPFRERYCGNVSVTCEDGRPEPLWAFSAEAFAPRISGCTDTPEVGLDALTSPVRCQTVVVDLAPGEVREIGNASLADSWLLVRGGELSTLRLEAATLERVQIGISGHAWIEIVGDSRLAEVVIGADPAMEGRVISLTDVEALVLGIQAGPRTEVRLQRTVVSDGAVQVGSLLADETTFVTSRIDAADALLAAVTISASDLEVGRASVISGALTESAVHRCETMRFRNSELRSSFVAACTTPTEVSGGTVSYSRLEGELHFMGSAVQSTVLAPGGGRPLELHNGDVRDVVMCDVARLAAFETIFTCVECIPDIPEVMLMLSEVDAPQCPALELAPDLADVGDAM